MSSTVDVVEIPDYVMRLTQIFRPIIKLWRNYAARKAERINCKIEPIIHQCKTRPEVDRLIGKPKYILSYGLGEISAEGCRWLSSNPTLGPAFDSVWKLSHEEFQERFGQSVQQFLEMAHRRTAELGLAVYPERTAVYRWKGIEFYIGLNGEEVVRVLSQQAYTNWDFAVTH